MQFSKFSTSILFLTFGIALAFEDSNELDHLGIQDWLREQREPVSTNSEDVFVTIQNGTLQGTTFVALGGDTIYAYLGVPYAKSPTGSLRFQAPEPYDESWGEEPRPANVHPEACVQFLTNTSTASEDCLFVSIYSKRRPNETDKPLPVLFFIHGGGFLLGQTSYYTASKLLQYDAVLVTVQYRMGPLGFLTMQDEILPGNLGMKDMVQGLKWVKENIAAFGGNPNSVTVFGQSAGAAATIFLMTSPLSKGLFHKAAAMSGTSIAEWSMDRDPIGSTERLALALNCSIESSEIIRDCLLEIEPSVISRVHFELMLNTQATSLRANLAGTSPTLECDHPGAFLSQEPLELLESGDIDDIPLMIGATQHEGSFLMGLAYALRLGWNGTLDNETYVHDKLIGDLLATWGVDESKNGASVSQVLASGYIPEDNPRTNFTTFQYELIDMFSALFMKSPILRTAEILSRRLSNVYLYSFEHTSKSSSLWNFVPIIPLIIPELAFLIPPFDGGITHADDLTYMFSFPVLPSLADREMAKTYCNFYTEFATNGKPSEAWAPFTLKEPNYMQIVSEPQLKQHYAASWRQGLTE